MATLALWAVGAAVGGSIGGGGAVLGISAATIGGVIGGAIGGWIDQTYTFPAFFGNNQGLQGPKNTDIQATTVVDGSPAKIVLGLYCRVGGTCIWQHSAGIHRAKRKGKKNKSGDRSPSTYSYSMSLAIAWAIEGPYTGVIRIWADQKLIYSPAGKDKRVHSVTTYPGDYDQWPDPVMESDHGLGNVPAYRGTCYTVLEGLKLADFGNRLPTQFTAQLSHSGGANVQAAVTRILKRSGLKEAYFNVSGLSIEQNFVGYTINGPQSTIKSLEPLAIAYDLTCRETNGQLVFGHRGADVDPILITEDDLSAHQSGNDRPRSLVITDGRGADMYSTVWVTYTNATNDFQQGSEKEDNPIAANSAVNYVDLPLTLTPTQAKKIAQRLLWNSWAERLKAELFLGPEFLHIEENDLLAVTDAGRTYRIRVTELAQGYNFIRHVKGIVEQSQTLFPVATSPDDTGNGGTPGEVPESVNFYLLNLPALTDDHVPDPGYYMAASFPSADDEFNGVSIFISSDNISYNLLDVLDEEVVAGVTTNALPTADATVRDDVNYLDVVVDKGVLVSASMNEVLAGANSAVVGSEIIGFETAALTAPHTYRLSKLWRARRDTWINDTDTPTAPGAASGATFILLESGPIRFVTLQFAGIDAPRYFKAVPPYGSIDDYPAQQFTPTAANLEPFRPYPITRNLTPDPVAADPADIIFTWNRRSRWVESAFGNANPPLDEPYERYHVQIIEAGGPNSGSVLRQVFVNDTTEYRYTLPLQNNRHASRVGESIYVQVRQVSDTLALGRSHFAKVLVE